MRQSLRRLAAGALLALATGVPAQEEPAPGADRDSLQIVPVRSIRGHLLEGQFIDLAGVYYDPFQDEIFICDPGAHRIAVATRGGVPSFSFGSAQTLAVPRRLVVDEDGRIYVADQAHDGIRVFDFDGEPLPDLDLSGVPAGARPMRPVALARRADGRLHIADRANGRIITLAADGRGVEVITAPPARADVLRSPVDIDLTPEGNLAVVDSQGVAVQIFDASGKYLRGWGEHDIGHHNFSLPSGIAVDHEGRIFVTDTLRQDIKVFAADGTFITNFGGLGSGPGAVRFPVDVATDRKGRVFVAERNNLRVQIFRVTEAP